MSHRCRGVKVVGFYIHVFLTPETHWFSVGIGSILRLDYIVILFSFSINYFCNEIVIFVVCHIIVHELSKLKRQSGIGLYTLAVQQVLLWVQYIGSCLIR